MNPLSPFTYYRRHKGEAILLLALIASLTLGVFVMVGVVTASADRVLYGFHYLTRMSRITSGQGLDSGILAQLRAHPDVAAVLPENGMLVFVPVGIVIPFPVLGVTGADLPVVLEACDLRLKEGRLVEPRTDEIVLTEELARALDLKIGDHVGYDINADCYRAFATELTLVGILESVPSDAGPEVRVGFVSYEYLNGHERYQPRATNWLIIPRAGRRTPVDEFALALVEGSGASASVRLEMFEREIEPFRNAQEVMNGMNRLANGIVAVSAALVVSMVNRIAITHRLGELGLLHASGYEKQNLVSRLVLEITVLTAIGWASGLLLSVLASTLLNTSPLAAVGPLVDPDSPIPFLSTLPTPVAVVIWVIISVRRVLNQLDPVAIIERGKLSMEDVRGRKQNARRKRQEKERSSRNPLSSWTFYRRHRMRSLTLLLSTGLITVGVALTPFVVNMMYDSMWPMFLSYASHTSIVSPAPTFQALDQAVLAQIRTHPAVAHVIPARGLTISANIGMGEYPLPVYGVREEDLQILLEVYDLRIGEGELAKPRSGEIVLTRALAQSRSLSVGDTVGKPIHELDGIPTELTVVGLLDSTAPGLARREGYRVPMAPRWAVFVSYEFVEQHERYATATTHALVVPVEGHAAEVETWLEKNIDSPQVDVETFGTAYHFLRDLMQRALLMFAMAEAILAVVAAFALAVLNRIFVAQRRDEFGVLHAAGHGRAALMARTVRESIGIAGAAWLIGAACCLAFLLSAQTIVYVPRGMSLDLTNPTPWLFTLPIPVAVVAASAGTIWWALSRLDPVAVIERR
jgi:ABC-type lipoprotein release transport system permease subunit